MTKTIEAPHDLLSDQDIWHAVIEGDSLGLAHPVPGEQHIAERPIYTNAVSIIESETLTAAMGGIVDATAVLLRASESAIKVRLAGREHGEYLERSASMAGCL